MSDDQKSRGKLNIKKSFILGGAFMATCIGSGFGTGSEFLQFFCVYGVKGAILSALVSLIIYIIFAKELFTKGYELPEEESTSLLSWYFGKKVGTALDWFCAFFVGGCYIIMLSGAGNTLHEYLGIPVFVGSALMAVCAIVTVMLGLRKLTDIIGTIGPVMGVLVIIVGICGIAKGSGMQNVDELIPSLGWTKAGSNWLIAGILYPCFCMMTLFPVIPAMGRTSGNRKTAVGAAVFGPVLFHVALIIMVMAILSNAELIRGVQVPNLAIAKMLNPAVAAVYVCVMILAIYTTACPMMWGFVGKFCRKSEKSWQYKVWCIGLTAVGMFASEYLSLATLINWIFGIIGYVGAVVFVGMFISNAIHKKRAGKQSTDGHTVTEE